MVKNNRISLLFTCGVLNIGGVEKSLISMLKIIDYERFKVYLLLPNFNGEIHSMLPPQVTVIIAPSIVTCPKIRGNSIISDLQFILKNNMSIVDYLKALFYSVFYGSKVGRQKYWMLRKDKLILGKELLESYDIAISYAGGIGLWNQLVIDKIKASTKICWIHGNYEIFGTGLEAEKSYFREFDNIVTVSESVRNIIVHSIPGICDKSITIHNIVNKNELLELAKRENVFKKNDDEIRFVSVSRLDKGKGFDLAIKSFSKVVERGYNIKWDIIGDGIEMNYLECLIKDLKMNGSIRLLGKKTNPYPFLYGSDVFFHPSRGEGKSISVDEAKLLCKPILITSYPTVSDQIIDKVTGRIVEISEEGLYDGIIEMATNADLRDQLSRNLENIDISHFSIQKINDLFDGEIYYEG